MKKSSKKEIKKPACINTTLWRKLKEEQKLVFVSCYEQFIDELNTLSSIHNRVKAHNLAYLMATSLETVK